MSSIKIIELGKYTTPRIVENRTKNWVEYGDDNNYYQTLIDAKESPTNSALINSITDMIYGRGLAATDAKYKVDEYAAALSLFNEECLRKICDDYYTFGQAALQVIYNQTHTKIVEVWHMPIQNLRAEKCNKDGDIEAYYYSDNWTELKHNEKPERIPAFGFSNSGLEVLVIKPYRAGYHYYAPVEYQSGLDYAFVEVELAKFHLNNIHNRFAANMIINFNNGVPDPEEQRIIESKIKSKYQGTEGEGLIVAFNDNFESRAVIETVQLNDAHNQYQFIAGEASQKIMISHRVTSPLLFGLPQNGGLGSNSDEILMASQLFDNVSIKPMQRVILESIKKVLAFNDIALNLFFKTSQPIDFTSAADMVSANEKQQATGVALSKEPNISDKELTDVFNRLEELGEIINEDEWELVDERPVDYDNEEALDKMLMLASTGVAKPNASSEQDGVTAKGLKYKVRYQYAPLMTSGNSREFCRKMVNAAKVYRKEDIIAMGDMPVNAGWGAYGADTYSIWFYKGGGNCHHYWMRKTYMAKDASVGVDATNPNAEISVNQARKAGVDLPTNEPEVAKLPVDMPNNGFVQPRKKK